MLTTISWTNYLVALAILLLIYYAIVLTFFYKQDIILLLTGNSRRIVSTQENGSHDLPGLIEPLGDELKALIGQSAYGNMPIEESKDALKRLMASERFQ
ncbi:MAG: hypothetical protein ABI091_17750, partial [Ferruginibacter sp.]